MTSFQLAVVQLDTRADLRQNLQQAAAYIEQAAQAGAQMVMLPETLDYIGPDMASGTRARFAEASELLGRLAARWSIYLHGGSLTEWMPDGKPCNTTLCFSPSGALLARYRKLHLFDAAVDGSPVVRESDAIRPGSEIVLARTRPAVLGLSICYDLRFPELYRLLALHGAEVLCVAANFTAPTGQAHWEPLLRARAIENACYVAAAGQTGAKHLYQAHGHSMIIDPWGNILAQLGEEPGFCMASLDPALILRARHRLPVLQNRRVDLYGLSSDHVRTEGEPT